MVATAERFSARALSGTEMGALSIGAYPMSLAKGHADGLMRVQQSADAPRAVYDATPGTRAPGSASGACGVAPYFPWSPSFPPLAPPPSRERCSQGSAVLCWCLTSPDQASPASAVCLPGADHLDTMVSQEISQFLRKECTRMPRLSDRAESDGGLR